MEVTAQDVLMKFNERYQESPLIIRSPGRINLIGEHTDYNDGFVMPAAIDRETVFAIAASPDGTTEIFSMKYNEAISIDLSNVQPVPTSPWANYLLGVMRQFLDKGYTLKPFRCVFGGNIPMGAGLSSSASVECGMALALSTLNGHDVPRQEMILMAQWSEHNFVGVKCGIMDQFASMMGSENHVIVLDCRSLEYQYAPMALTDVTIVLCDSKVKHSLVDSEYNTRRHECEQGVAILKQHYPAVKSLRDVNDEQLEKHKAELPGKVFDRCQYVVQEIERVQQARKDLENHDLHAFGEKMFQTHEGLSRLYEVSCPELDFLVKEAVAFDGVLGSRMMGGGFGGCTINLVRKEAVGDFLSHVKIAYAEQFGIAMESYIVNIKDGTSVFGKPIGKITLL